MQVEFLESFLKDIEKIDDSKVLAKIEQIILNIESSKTLKEIPNLKKLIGYKNIFRIKFGNYRIGLFFENDVVELARVLHGKDIYRIFP